METRIDVLYCFNFYLVIICIFLVFPTTLDTKNDKLIWLDGTDADDEGIWRWGCDGSVIPNYPIFAEDNYDQAPPIDFANCLAWAWKHPNGYMGFSWGDENCEERKYPLCKCNDCECGKGKSKLDIIDGEKRHM